MNPQKFHAIAIFLSAVASAITAFLAGIEPATGAIIGCSSGVFTTIACEVFDV